jgi:NADH dehydrogenase
VADLRFLRFAGFAAWLVWAGVHIYFLIGFANRFFVMLQWAISFLTKRRQVRIFPIQKTTADVSEERGQFT